ncbi:MAG: 3-dehydroquinate synthase [Acidobacteria bacterium]|nr:3-dehydroquinate synthase [Acidobacteriota bacterium]
MSASFEIGSSSGSYRVEVECGSFQRSLSGFAGSAVIADEFFKPRFEEAGAQAVFVEAVETNKSLEASPGLIEQMRRSGANRQTRMVAVGGGIIQDLSAFIASVYMRGLRWTYMPTTVLAMVDSCIGGKSSINVGPYKNLVGTFHPPEVILIDPEVIATLPEDQRASGLIEAAKICFCRGEEAFARHVACKPSTQMSAESLEPLIINSLQSKKWFIEIDEFDKNERLLLNFGHTFGHAIEGATHFAIGHGIAVGLGIICALEFERLRGVDYSGNKRVAALETHLDEMVRSWTPVADELKKLPMDDVLDRFGCDKKHGKDFYTLILVAQNGDVELRKVERSDATLAQVRTAIERMVERYG